MDKYAHELVYADKIRNGETTTASILSAKPSGLLEALVTVRLWAYRGNSTLAEKVRFSTDWILHTACFCGATSVPR